MKYTHSQRGGSGSPPPTIHLRTDDVRDNIHSHLCHAKCPMTVGGGGGGGGAMAVSCGRGVIFVLKFKNCIQKGSLHTNFIKTLILP